MEYQGTSNNSFNSSKPTCNSSNKPFQMAHLPIDKAEGRAYSQKEDLLLQFLSHACFPLGFGQAEGSLFRNKRHTRLLSSMCPELTHRRNVLEEEQSGQQGSKSSARATRPQHCCSTPWVRCFSFLNYLLFSFP